MRGAYEAAGPAGRRAKDALHGVWLGHPLHPVFTDVPLGAWTTALAMDAAADGDPGMRRAATFAMGVGLAGAVGAAVTGLTDWSETDGQSRRTGLMNGLLNVAATTLFATSFALRQKDAHAENAMVRARAGDTDVLLVRQHGRVCALVHACAHLGGPLSEGTLKEGSVVCPWHGSEFALDDGRVLAVLLLVDELVVDPDGYFRRNAFNPQPDQVPVFALPEDDLTPRAVRVDPMATFRQE